MRYRILRMRLPSTAHTSKPWRIHELTTDFRLEDLWELPGVGGPDDFPRLVALIASLDPSQGSSRAARVLWATRWKVGALLGWDDPDAGLGSRVPTLRDRLPADLRDASGPQFDALPLTSLYLTDDEWAAEIANQTMHGVMHIARVPDDTGGFRARMASRSFAVEVCSGGGSFDDASYEVPGDLAGGGVDAVERVDRCDCNHQGR